MIAGGTRQNLAYIKNYTKFDPQLTEVERLLAADAQTSGGLLISLPQVDAEKFMVSFDSGFQVGKIIERRESLIFVNH